MASAPTAPTLQKMTVLLSSVSSDSHTWNLVYLELVLIEAGYRVVNLGACVPDALLISNCRHHDPDLVVISSVNGHGAIDGERVIRRIRTDAALAALPVAIGGKLGTGGQTGVRERTHRLRAAGFDGVYDEPADASHFLALAGAVRRSTRRSGGRNS
jgi:methylaspartate mutase sigma subunit